MMGQGLDYGLWNKIQEYVQRELGRRHNTFVQSKVLKRDEVRRVVWVKELGDQPIPIIGFDYEIKSYDTEDTGVKVRKTIAKPKVPEIGEMVLIARHMDSDRLPKCLGVIQSIEYVDPSLLENV